MFHLAVISFKDKQITQSTALFYCRIGRVVDDIYSVSANNTEVIEMFHSTTVNVARYMFLNMHCR